MQRSIKYKVERREQLLMHSLFDDKSFDTPLLVRPMSSQSQGQSSGILFNYQKLSESHLFWTEEPTCPECPISGKSNLKYARVNLS